MGTPSDVRLPRTPGRGVGPRNDFVPFGDVAPGDSVPSRFERQAAEHAARLAVKSPSQALSHEALNRAANGLAHALLAERGATREPVALFLGHGAAPIVALLGAMKAGKIAVPLDPVHPPARTAHALKDSGAALVVTAGPHLAALREWAPGPLTTLDLEAIVDWTGGRGAETPRPQQGRPAHNPGLAIPTDAPALIYYTSGSTGTPKGVVHTHGNVLHNVRRRTPVFHLCADDRMALVASYSFGGTGADIFGALLNGGAVVTYDLRTLGPEGMAAWLLREEVTVIHVVATVFRQLVGSLKGDEVFPKLRIIALGGETLRRRDVELFRQHFAPTGCLLRLGMGLTETCGCGTSVFLDATTEVPDDVMPSGYPAEESEVQVVDEAGRPVAPGQVGEIVIRSRYLSAGYWRKPELNQALFAADPQDPAIRSYRTGDMGTMAPDGCLFHLGRKDFQLKVRGHRVQAAEVETALLEMPEVREAAVAAREDAEGAAALVAYVVLVPGCSLTVSALRARLRERLAEPMVPSAYVFLDALPVTATGKVDRRALPGPDGSRPRLDAPFAAPRTPVERALAGMWSDVLGVSPVGVHDDFFDLGGHSLKATRLASRVRQAFGVELPLAQVFAAPTVEALALSLVQRLAEGAGIDDASRMVADVESPPGPEDAP